MKTPFDFRVIEGGGVERIHAESLRILEKIGIRVPHPAYLDRLREMGAHVDAEHSIVRFPPKVLEEAIAQQKQNNDRYYRDHETDVDEDYRQSFFMSGGNNKYLVDPVTLERREGTVSDIMRAIILGNNLPNVERVSGFVLPREFDHKYADIAQFYLLSVYSSKRYFFTYIYSRESARALIEMAEVVAETDFDLESGNLIEYELEPFRNLDFAAKDLEIAKEFTDRGIKTATTYWSWMGRNAPLEYAAMLAITNANILAGLALLIAMNPENMYFRYIFPPHMVNPREPQQALMGNVNQIVFSWAARQLADFYGFKYTITNSGFSDSIENDFQAGFEVGVTAALAIAAGVTSNGVKGVVGMDQGVSLARLLADHEMYGYLNEAFSRRIDVNHQTLQSAVVDAAGIGGDFLACLTDQERVTSMYAESPVFFSGDYESWKVGPRGGRRLGDRVERIIGAGFPPQPVINQERIHRLDHVVERNVADPSFLPRLKQLVSQACESLS